MGGWDQREAISFTVLEIMVKDFVFHSKINEQLWNVLTNVVGK